VWTRVAGARYESALVHALGSTSSRGAAAGFQAEHIRNGASFATIPILGAEMGGANTKIFMQTLNRMAPALSIRELRNLKSLLENSTLESPPFLMFMEIMDSCPVNLKAVKVQALHLDDIPGLFQYVQRCDAHQCCLITMRPFSNYDVVNPLYCMTRLLRMKARSCAVMPHAFGSRIMLHSHNAMQRTPVCTFGCRFAAEQTAHFECRTLANIHGP